jgi:hypothetical protein
MVDIVHRHHTPMYTNKSTSIRCLPLWTKKFQFFFGYFYSYLLPLIMSTMF